MSHKHASLWSSHRSHSQKDLTHSKEESKKEVLSKHIRKWDQEQWEKEVNEKRSLQVYKKGKQNIKEDTIYDNTISSVILYQARTNSLRLEDRQRHVHEKTLCRLCQKESEDLAHFVLRCPELNKTRQDIPQLQKPHKEDDNESLKDFLFNIEDNESEMEKKKEALIRLWKTRKSILLKQ